LKFTLKGEVEATADLTNIVDEIGRLVEEANNTILKRGAPSEEQAARIVEFAVKGKKVEVCIEGTRFVRAHDALKRFKNFLARNLERYRIGVRRVFVPEYLIEVPGSRERFDDLRYYPLVKEIEEMNGTVKILLRDVDEGVIDRRDIDRLVKLVQPEVRTIQRELADKVGLVIERSVEKPVKFFKDPTEEALRLKWIARFPGRGQWYYLPAFTKLMNAIRDIVFKEVSWKLGFIEAVFPKLIPIEIAFRARKIQGEPGGMYYVCAPRFREKERYKPFQVLAEITNELPMEELKKLLEDPGYILDPVQCLPFYYLYYKATLRKEDLPIKVVEAGGPTYRYEAGGVKGVERVSEFWRVEHVWMGLKEQVEEIRNQVIERMKYVVDKLMDVEWRIQFAGDTFYLAEDQRVDEDIDIPQQPKLELQIWLPYKGGRDNEGAWLACGSFNLHGNHYTKLFNIKCATGETLYTACFGAGITRLAIAFLAQHGFNIEDWPEEIKRSVGKLEFLPGVK